MIDLGGIDIDHRRVRVDACMTPGPRVMGFGVGRAAVEGYAVVDMENRAGEPVIDHMGKLARDGNTGRRLGDRVQVHVQPHWNRVTVPEERRSATMWAHVTDSIRGMNRRGTRFSGTTLFRLPTSPNV